MYHECYNYVVENVNNKGENMKRLLLSFVLMILAIAAGYVSYKYLNGKYEILGVFLSGIFTGIFIMTLSLNSKNDKIKTYKRELEKEAISSDESIAKVKVLESKIQVLEKALENALNK